MGSSTKWILVTMLHCGYRVVRTVVHYVLVLAYWSRGTTVPPVTDPILKTSATQLAKQIREGKLSSETVVRVFIKRISEVDPLIHAIAEKRFEHALREARDVDALIASGSVSRQRMAKDKPLLGVPFTVKSLFTVKDFPCTVGSLLFKDVRGHEDSPPVKQMREAGAILLASTNMPEMGMNLESTNYMYGTTCNPYDTSRTTGGSTGGEAALLGAAGSVVGIGNDMAGSIRMPCMFAGLFGHKPSIGIVPNGGTVISPEAKHLLYTGPMCRYAEDLVTTMKVLAFQNKKNINFDREVNFEGLKVFYLYSPGHIPLADKPDKDMRDAVKQVVSHFETKFGSKTQELTIPLLRQINKIWVHDVLSPVKNVADTLTLGKAKVDEILEAVKFIFRQSIHTLGVVTVMNVKSIPLVYDPKAVEKYKKLGEELDDQFRSLLDDRSILVMPTWPFPAPYHGEMTLSMGDICYCNIFNVVGLPSTQCPVRLNDKGLPVGVQVIGRKGNDALTIACAMELEKAFGGWVAPK